MDVRAISRYERTAPNKLRQVTGEIVGLPVGQARQLLQVSPKAAATPVRKTLDSAVANAENNHDLDADDLVVSEVLVDEGPTLRRFRPRAMGRATRVRKRTSHLTVRVGVAAKRATPTHTARTPKASAGEQQE
jgi:large subunit ribosomal protein L22